MVPYIAVLSALLGAPPHVLMQRTLDDKAVLQVTVEERTRTIAKTGQVRGIKTFRVTRKAPFKADRVCWEREFLESDFPGEPRIFDLAMTGDKLSVLFHDWDGVKIQTVTVGALATKAAEAVLINRISPASGLSCVRAGRVLFSGREPIVMLEVEEGRNKTLIYRIHANSGEEVIDLQAEPFRKRQQESQRPKGKQAPR